MRKAWKQLQIVEKIFEEFILSSFSSLPLLPESEVVQEEMVFLYFILFYFLFYFIFYFIYILFPFFNKLFFRSSLSLSLLFLSIPGIRKENEHG